MPDLSLTPETLALGFIWFVAFLFSTTCHEAAHALVAKIGGDSTAALGGQLSLNPIPHIRRAPFGMVVVPLLSFFLWQGMIGWANAPYDPLWERRHPRRSAWMALAGPAANFTLMLLAVLALRIGLHYDLFSFDPVTGKAGFSFLILNIVFRLNLLLGTFNLIPAPRSMAARALWSSCPSINPSAIWTGFAATISPWLVYLLGLSSSSGFFPSSRGLRLAFSSEARGMRVPDCFTLNHWSAALFPSRTLLLPNPA